MIYIKIYLPIVLAFCLQSCGAIEKCPKGDICVIKFYNNSSDIVELVASHDLPDTSLSNIYFIGGNAQGIINPKEVVSLPTTGWKNTINKLCPSGKIMFVVMNNDTIKQYGWDDVKANYRIEKRYELSIDDLEKMNWSIVYP